MSIRALTQDDLEQLFALRQIGFLDRSDFSDETVRARHRARMPYTTGYFLDGKLTSAAVCYPFKMFLAGQRVRSGGVAGVVSAAETRRRGFVRELLRNTLRTLHEDGVGWALEYPFDPRFYARFGFATVPIGCEVTVPAEKLFAGAAPDAQRFTGDTTCGAEACLGPIYDAWAEHYALTLARDIPARPTWSRILGGNRFCYLLDDAYAVMELTATGGVQTLTVHDYAFASPNGRNKLWLFVGSFHGQVDLIRLHLPGDEPLGFDMQRHHTNELPFLQVRIADLPAALGPLVSPTEASFILRVCDSFCSWNDGIFHVAFGPSGSTLTPSRAKPQLSLDISTLTRLVTGALGAAAALRTGLAEGEEGEAQALAALSHGRTTFMPRSDFF
jgi:predicted acetyltransferase